MSGGKSLLLPAFVLRPLGQFSLVVIMKKKCLSCCFMVLLVLLAGCNLRGHRDRGRSLTSQEDFPLQGDTTVVKVVQDSLPFFHSVSVFDASRVEVIIGKDCLVEVDGQKVYTDAQQVHVDDGHLSVHFSDDDSNHRQTRVKVMLPTLHSLTVVGCGRLDIHGQSIKGENVKFLLRRVNVAFVAPVLSVDNLDVSLDAVMYSQFRPNCKKLNLTVHHISQTKLAGHVAHLSVDADDKRRIDLSGLK